MYYKRQHYEEPSVTANIMDVDDNATADSMSMDTNNGVSSPEQTVKDLQIEIRRLKRQVPPHFYELMATGGHREQKNYIKSTAFGNFFWLRL